MDPPSENGTWRKYKKEEMQVKKLFKWQFIMKHNDYIRAWSITKSKSQSSAE